MFAKVSTNHLPIKCLVNCPGWPFTAHDSIDELLQCHLQTNGTCRSQNGRPSVCENFCLTQRWENLFGNFFTKKHHRSRSTGKTRLYHDFSNKHRQFPQIRHSQHCVPVLAISVVQQMEQRCPLAGHEVMLIWITQNVWAHAGHKRYTARVLMWSNWSCAQCLVCKCARMLYTSYIGKKMRMSQTFSRFVIILVGAAP